MTIPTTHPGPTDPASKDPASKDPASKDPDPTDPHLTDPAVPLAIWPVGQTTAQYQRAGRYLAECTDHPAKMLPFLAQRIVEEYSKPGDLVVDPMCGIGTTLVEAASGKRRATGIEHEPRWASLAEKNLRHVLTDDQLPLATVRQGDARVLTRLLGGDAGTVDLVLTSPPSACDTGNPDRAQWGKGGGLCPTTERNYSASPTNLGHARDAAYEEAMADIYASCLNVLRPGGLLVVVTKNTRRKGGVFDLAGMTVSLARCVGFTYLQHVVALHAAIRHGTLVARPSFWQITQMRKARERGEPVHLVVSENVAVFSKPPSSLSSGTSEVNHAQ